MTVKTKIKHYDALNVNNDLAKAALMGLELNSTSALQYGSNPAESIMKGFSDSIAHVEKMAAACCQLGNAVTKNKVLSKLRNIQRQGIEAVAETAIAAQLGYADSDLQQTINDKLYTKVKRLTECMRDPADERFQLENIETLHDMIRYLHQIGVNNTYGLEHLNDCNSEQFKKIDLSSSGTLLLIDIDNVLPERKQINGSKISHPLIAPIVQLYNNGFNKHGTERFNGILMKHKLMTQVHMGDHYSEIEAGYGVENYVEFYFMDTPQGSYRNSKHRTKYVVNVLKKLGFETNTRTNETNSVWHGQTPKEVGEKLKEVVRLAASTKDLDLSGSRMDKYPHKSVNEFMKGSTDMYNLLRNWYNHEVKDDPKID